MDKNKTSVQGIVILCILFVAFSAAAFLLPFRRNGVFWLSYLFTVAAFAAQVYIFRISFLKGPDVRSKFYGFPIARLGVVYLCVQLLLGFVFMALAAVIPAWFPTVLYVLLLSAAAVGVIASDAMRDEIARQDTVLKAGVSAMRTLQSKANALPGRCNDAALSAQLQKLAEAFRYSDPVSSADLQDAEHELKTALDELELAVTDGEFDSAAALIQKTQSLLSERNRLCKLGKGT